MDVDEPDHATTTPEPHQSLWFKDGNVVLQAGTSRFKVFQSILCRESPVFNDMFSFPQPPSSGVETHEGCPLIQLPDDADEVKLLLSTIFDANFLDEQASLRDHVLILKVSTKYQAYRVVRRVMVIFNHHYPDTLEAYDHWAKEDPDGYACPAMPRTCSNLPDPGIICQLLPIARMTGMHILLPVIFIQLSRESAANIVKNGEYLKLSSEDAASILLAHRLLERLAKTTVFPCLYDSRRDISPACESPGRCHDARHWLIRRMQPDEDDAAIPFPYAHEFNLSERAGLCAQCYDCLEESYMRGRKKAWDELPSILGLGTWEELRIAQRAAMGES